MSTSPPNLTHRMPPIDRPTGPNPAVEAANRLYRIDAWGQGFFGINDAGHVVVKPTPTDRSKVDLYDIVRTLDDQGLGTPIILGFSDLLATRIAELHQAFSEAKRTYCYQGLHHPVYPIKANQQKQLVREILAAGQPYGMGLEVGSKPELLAALGQGMETADRMIIGNGFKDKAYVEQVFMAGKLGRTIMLVMESISELDLVMAHAKRFEVRPPLGLRVRLHARASSRWERGSGEEGKFGLNAQELVQAVDRLRERGWLSQFQFLHCHMASQLSDLHGITSGVTELARLYVELRKRGADLRYLDVGGGLGVDYDGTATTREFSVNYDMPKYAAAVVGAIARVCDEADAPHPNIVTEAGRALVAHHSVLLFKARPVRRAAPPPPSRADLRSIRADQRTPPPLRQLIDLWNQQPSGAVMATVDAAQSAYDQALDMFNNGRIDLIQRGLAEQLFALIRRRLHDRSLEEMQQPREPGSAMVHAPDSYLANLSIFQSLPDSWAIGQVFPVLPIHRLHEPPTRLVSLVDLTCDSDGKLDRFPVEGAASHPLPVHDVAPGQDYYLGAFLTGAYQETLGDLHNLFGDPHVVNIKIEDADAWSVQGVVKGDTVGEVLQYVQYDPSQMLRNIIEECEQGVREHRLGAADAQAVQQVFQRGLTGQTYLDG